MPKGFRDLRVLGRGEMRVFLWLILAPMIFACALDTEVMGDFNSDCELDSVAEAPCRVRVPGVAIATTLGEDITQWSRERIEALLKPSVEAFPHLLTEIAHIVRCYHGLNIR